jgi:quercetin dioxygenase-like cupin family protein
MTLIDRADLPLVQGARELEGYLHGGVPASFIFVDGAPGSGPKLHVHPYVEIFVIQEGQATFTVGEDVIEAHAGQMLIAPAGVPHKFTNTGSETLRQVDIHLCDHFETEWLED